ncbi:MAG: hypothetical protein IMZ61_11395, partial [Planctomycetes bacterium]|nr:hypothetical protein [Planctomycetota bacterium]
TGETPLYYRANSKNALRSRAAEPMDVYTGRAKEVLTRRAEIKRRMLQTGRLQNLQAQAVEV